MASFTASSSDVNEYAESTGPNTSSRTTVDEGVTPVSTVGCTKYPPRSAAGPPPHATDAPSDKLEQLLKLTERYCVVYQTLKRGPPIELELNRA